MAVTKRRTLIKKGDTVIVVAGGNSKKKQIIGKKGKVLRVVNGERLVIEGLNFVSKHQKQTAPNKPHGKIPRESPVHCSNVMYFSEKAGAPVRLRKQKLADGKIVRGFLDPKKNVFEQVDV